MDTVKGIRVIRIHLLETINAPYFHQSKLSTSLHLKSDEFTFKFLSLLWLWPTACCTMIIYHTGFWESHFLIFEWSYYVINTLMKTFKKSVYMAFIEWCECGQRLFDSWSHSILNKSFKSPEYTWYCTSSRILLLYSLPD